MGNQQSSPLQQCLDAVCSGQLGCVSYPDYPLYQKMWVKPYNLEVPVSPIAVIRPENAQDVAKAVKCASKEGVHVQAKSGGHSYGNFGLGGESGGLMIDLVKLENFDMDTTTWQATLGAGHRLGNLDKKLHQHGRALPHGICPGVGIGGHATIGGIGPMSRMWGTTLDHVVEVEVVTADSKIVKANETVNADLFWALRGAGASFGIITQFKVKTRPELNKVVQYSYTFNSGNFSQLAPVYERWQNLIGDPDLDQRYSSFLIVQPLGVVITGTFYGTKEEYEKSGIPDRLPTGGVLNLTTNDWFGHLTHAAVSAGLMLGDISSHFYGKSLAFRQQDLLSSSSVSALFSRIGEVDATAGLWFIIFDSTGGAMNDVVPQNATAYPHRDKAMMYQSYIVGLPHLTPQGKKLANGVHEVIQRAAPGAKMTYAGYVDPEMGRSEAQQVYWGPKLPQLRKIKKTWDPTDIFRNPQSVEATLKQ